MISSDHYHDLNPILGYKLDPGEPGLAYSAPASRSIIRVLTQELSNLIAFKNEALRKGGVVIYSKISLDMQKRGMFLAAVAGRTEARMLIPDEKKKDNVFNGNLLYSQQSLNESQEVKLEKLKSELERQLLMEKNPEKIEEIKRKIALLNSLLNNPVLKNSELVLQGLLVNETG